MIRARSTGCNWMSWEVRLSPPATRPAAGGDRLAAGGVGLAVLQVVQRFPDQRNDDVVMLLDRVVGDATSRGWNRRDQTATRLGAD